MAILELLSVPLSALIVLLSIFLLVFIFYKALGSKADPKEKIVDFVGLIESALDRKDYLTEIEKSLLNEYLSLSFLIFLEVSLDKKRNNKEEFKDRISVSRDLLKNFDSLTIRNYCS